MAAGRNDSVGQEFLGDQTAEGMPHDDGLDLGGADELGIVIDHLRDAHVVEGIWVVPGGGHSGAVAGPARGGGAVAAAFEQLDPGRPGGGMNPQAVDEDDGVGLRR
jgi:hypothetical protein